MKKILYMLILTTSLSGILINNSNNNVQAKEESIKQDEQQQRIMKLEKELDNIKQQVKELPTWKIVNIKENRINKLQNELNNIQNEKRQLKQLEFDFLSRLVEAEAGNQGIKGKILVANVIINRVKSNKFPDTYIDVIFQNTKRSNGKILYQFSPLIDGRFWEVMVTDETKEAVKQALEGIDYSNGALFFMNPVFAEKNNAKWMKSLVCTVKYKDHVFYK